MKILAFISLCFLFTSCTVDVTNGIGSQSFSMKTDFSVLNQRQTLVKTSETIEAPDGSKSTKVSEHFEKGFAIEVVNLKK